MLLVCSGMIQLTQRLRVFRHCGRHEPPPRHSILQTDSSTRIPCVGKASRPVSCKRCCLLRVGPTFRQSPRFIRSSSVIQPGLIGTRFNSIATGGKRP